MKRIVLVTGGFDPLHSGHVELLKEARKLGDKLIVGINSDKWLTNKKGRPFMEYDERANIVKHLSMVNGVLDFDDSDGTACNAIFKMLAKYGNEATIIFANGGDRGSSNTPEYNMYKNTYGVDFAWSVGGKEKKNSSSCILEEWKFPKTKREWGYYRVLHRDGSETKVKELVVDPGKSLSLQKHEKRAEMWMVTHGIGTLFKGDDLKYLSAYRIKKHDSTVILTGQWHQLVNESDDELRVVEIQAGENCIEEDIIRYFKH